MANKALDLITYGRNEAAAVLIRHMKPCPTTPHPDEVLELPSQDAGHTVKAHVYRSKKTVGKKGPQPVLINLHGSGFVMTWHGSDDYYCRKIANETEYTVLDCKYRLGPENPFPGAVHDAEDAVKYVLSKPDEFDSSKISIGGFSAGGNLSVAVAVAGKIPANTFRSMLLFYPPTDLSINNNDKKAPDTTGEPIPPWMVSIFNSSYIAHADPKDPLISPARGDVKKLPKNMLVITCACDPLSVETEGLADRIAKETPDTHLVRWRVPGVNHAWDKEVEEGSEGAKKRDEAYEKAVEMLSR